MKRNLFLLVALLGLVTGLTWAQRIPTIEFTKTFYLGDASDYPELKKEFMDEFSRRFGVKLVINTFPRNVYMEKLNLAITSGELKGLVLPFFPGNVLEYRDAGSIISYDDLLQDNAIWRGLPEYFKSSGKFDDGKIWSIAAGWGVGDPYARSYRKDWADKLGIRPPQTVDQLYEMAKAFTLRDPDGNGKQDTFGMTAAGLWNMQDIFQAFDARLNNFGADSIVYDPNENAWIDSMLKPEMLDALRYLNRIYKEGILDPEIFVNTSSQMREKAWSGKYGSVFYGYWWGMTALLDNLAKNAPEAKIDFITALSGRRTRNIVHRVAGGGTVVMLAGTPNAKEMANAFVNTFLGNDEAGLWGIYGIEGKMWRRDGDRIVVLKDPASGNAYPGVGVTVFSNPRWQTGKYASVVEGDRATMDAFFQKRALWTRTLEDNLAKGIWYDASGLKDVSLSPTYTTIINDVRKYFSQLMAKVATGELAPEAAVAQYRAQMKSMDGQKMLAETNQKMGLRLPARYVY